MLALNSDGMCISNRIVHQRFPTIEGPSLEMIQGIVVHQTEAKDKESTFGHYKKRGVTGAHFLIDKDGTIYQTASLFKMTKHVGMLQSRCLSERRCTPVAFKADQGNIQQQTHRVERSKPFPDRYPANKESVGIEIVGKAYPDPAKKGRGEPTFEAVNDAQNTSLKWLVSMLTRTFGVSMREIYRHSEIGVKNKTEASTARW